MKLIEQSTNVWGQTPCDKQTSINWIERAGRVCYRSEDKIVEGSGQKFVENIMVRKHFSVIEHSNIVLRLKHKSKFPQLDLELAFSIFNSPFFQFCIHRDRVYVAGNWRTWIEFYNKHHPEDQAIVGLGRIPDIFESDQWDLVYYEEEIPIDVKAVTTEFITDRAVTHELVRHRPASYSQESQRYCNYKDDIEFVLPSWYYDADQLQRSDFYEKCMDAEDAYRSFINHGLRPEHARVVLPNSCATKIVMTAYVPEWRHVINLRTSKAAYPQIRKMIEPVKRVFEYQGWL